MYPFVRMAKEFVKFRKAPPLDLLETHVSQHRCWPWDVDVFMELNNGRSLTLYDLGRFPLAKRVGLITALRRNGWALTMAGCSVRWRARIRPFERFEMRSRAVGWDDKFVYLDQTMWKSDGRCASQALYRSAVTGAKGIVPPAEVMAAMGRSDLSPQLPDWVKAWVAADSQRTWPPVREN